MCPPTSSRRLRRPVGERSWPISPSCRMEKHASLLTYECRTATTDADSRIRFLRYWRLIRPFVAHIFRATVATIRDHAESE